MTSDPTGPESTHHEPPNWLGWLIAFSLIVAVGLSIGTLILAHHVDTNADKIGQLERQDARRQRAVASALTVANARQDTAIVAARAAVYRICSRQMVNRIAFSSLDRDHDEPSLPILDCRPNLVGLAAVRATRAQVRALVRQVRAGRAP